MLFVDMCVSFKIILGRKIKINPINPQEGITEAFSDVSSKYSLVTQHAPLSGTLLITATKPNDLKESRHVSQSPGTAGTWLPMRGWKA